MPASTILRGVSSANSGASATANSQIVVTAPAGVTSGDRLALIITLRTAMGAAWVAPAGWALVNNPSLQGAGEGYVYTATYGTDVSGASWTFNPADAATANKWAWTCVALNGSQVGAVQASAWGGQGAASTALNLGPVSPTGSGYLLALAGDRASGSTWTWSTGWVEESDTASTGTNSCSATSAIFDTTPVAAGSYTATATATNSTANSWWGLVAYNPAASGTGQGAGTASWTVTASGAGITSRAGSGTAAWSAGAAATGSAPAVGIPSHTYGIAALASDGVGTATLTGDGTSVAVLAGNGASTAVLAAQTLATVTLHTDD